MGKSISRLVLAFCFLCCVQVYTIYNPKEIFACAEKGDVAFLRLLAKSGENLNIKDDHGRKLIHYACACGYLDMLIFLVEEVGESIHEKDKKGSEPIHYASVNGRLDIFKYLEKKGADINQKKHNKKQPIHYAAQCGKLGIVKHILKQNGDLDCVNKDGNKPIYCALINKEEKVFNYLHAAISFDISHKKVNFIASELDNIKNIEMLKNIIHIALSRKKYIEKKWGFLKRLFSFNWLKKNNIEKCTDYNFHTYCDIVITLFEKAQKNRAIKNVILEVLNKQGDFQKKYFSWVIQDVQKSELSLYSAAKIGTILRAYTLKRKLHDRSKKNLLADVKIICKGSSGQ